MDLATLGIASKKLTQFRSKGIETVNDLLSFVPRLYHDFRTPLETLSPEWVGKTVAILGTIQNVRTSQSGVPRLYCTLQTKNYPVTLMWFGQSYLYSRIDYYAMHTSKVMVCGKLDYTLYSKGFQISAPMIITDRITEGARIYPVYSKIQGMSDDYLQTSIQKALAAYKEPEPHTREVLDKFGLCSLKQAYEKLHQPQSMEDVREGSHRLLFDKLYTFAGEMLKNDAVCKESSFVLKEMTQTAQKIKSLPYALTGDQLNTVRTIARTAKNKRRIDALLQGDVGCGKTVVAFLSMLLFAENGYQSVLMAPTQVLAEQHANTLKEFLQDTPFADRFVFLKSNLKAKEKREALSRIKDGSALFIVGTHAVIGKSVTYYRLALTIVDEEHKFGVVQRTALTEKAEEGVHAITMSATPIPRSVAQTIYGEYKTIFSILQMPNGRKPVETTIAVNDREAFAKLLEQIECGRQAYIVFPTIDKSKNEKMQKVEAVTDFFQKFEPWFQKHGIRAACLTGKTSATETTEILSAFTKGEVQVLCATTIVEVGVNVPNASLIMIRNADRFGLAQLHQLRGRVGRGNHQSYCVLCSDNAEENKRLQILCSTSNGFEIAMEDLKLRGTGDLVGIKQSGNDDNVKLMLAYPELYHSIKDYLKAR